MNSAVYVGSNDPSPGGNAVLAYRRSESGGLSLLGSFPSRGTGVANPAGILGPDDSDQNVIVNPGGTMLFAVNGGSDTIAVFDIHADGSLSHVDGSPFPSGGVQPVSLGLAGDHLYVVNKDQDPARPSTSARPNCTGFAVSDQGRLSPIPGSTVTVGEGPTQALISPSGDLLFGADLLAGMLQSMRIMADGRLEQRPPTPIDARPPGPLGLAAHPTRPLVYACLPSANRLAVYSYDPAGAATPVTTVPNSGRALCWISLNHQATRLDTSNKADNSLSGYDITDPMAPMEIQHLSLNSPQPVPAVDGSQREFLYVAAVNLSAPDPGRAAHDPAGASGHSCGRRRGAVSAVRGGTPRLPRGRRRLGRGSGLGPPARRHRDHDTDGRRRPPRGRWLAIRPMPRLDRRRQRSGPGPGCGCEG